MAEEVVRWFTADEATFRSFDDLMVLRLTVDPTNDERVDHIIAMLRAALYGRPELRLRVSGDVPRTSSPARDWRNSMIMAQQFQRAAAMNGIPPDRIDLWGWGSGRPLIAGDPSADTNGGITVELVDSRDAGYEPESTGP